ncbi:divalent-cation tolerance protein CutA [Pleionea sediminis]|uniref:divalent-cation tolerance protein CutA n=1 Tax=Pleionea sediminis TaxID=2569479 RepID=UPI001186BDE1|nr:divalent-cation tolerance protein CutA [Pleionea sediminis]
MQQTDDTIVLLTTVPDLKTGQLLAQTLVEQKIAACVNLLPVMQSYYLWQGEIECDNEQQLIIKTESSLLNQAETLIRKHHPYEVPELIAIKPTAMGEDYLEWLKQCLQK